MPNRGVDFFSVLAVLFVAAIPFAVMAWYVSSQTTANFQDDYGFYISRLALIWNQGISYEGIVNGSLHGFHFGAIPLLFRALAMAFGRWDPFIESYAALFLGLGRVALIYLIFARVLPNRGQRFAMLIVTSFLIFAPVQLGLYVYGDTGLPMGLDSFGFLLGFWGAVAFPRSWRGTALIAFAGFISSWSWGAGVAWGVFFIAMLLYRFSFQQIATVVMALVLVHAPIVKIISEMDGGFGSFGGRGSYDFFNYRMIVGALGRQFVSDVTNIADYPYANGIGFAGLTVLIIMTLLILYEMRMERRLPLWVFPSAILIIYSTTYIYQVSLARTGIGAWYVAITVYFWIGIAVLAIAQIQFPIFANRTRILKTTWGLAILILIAVLYIPANQSFENKTPFLLARTPSSESCLRHYKTAPTYCEMLVFFWPPTYELPSFGRFFEEVQLSVFGSRQTWSLQGDYLLNTVTLSEDPELPQIQWIGEKGYQQGIPANWQSHHRLGLYIPNGQKVNWKIHLMSPMKKALFKANIQNFEKAPMTVSIVAQEVGQPDQILFKQAVDPGATIPIKLDIAMLAGRSITLVLSTHALGRTLGAALHYPRIEIDRERTPSKFVTESYRDIQGSPENTRPSSGHLLTRAPKDIVLKGASKIAWHDLYNNGMNPSDGPVCAGDFSALEITLAMPENITIRMLRIIVATRKPNGNYYENDIQLPLLKDGKLHTYTIDMKLINLDKRNKLEGVRMAALSDAASSAEKEAIVEIPEVLLVHNGLSKTFCR